MNLFSNNKIKIGIISFSIGFFTNELFKSCSFEKLDWLKRDLLNKKDLLLESNKKLLNTLNLSNVNNYTNKSSSNFFNQYFSFSSNKESDNQNESYNKRNNNQNASNFQHTNFIADAVENVLDSVVNITVQLDSSGLFQKKDMMSTGSGFIVAYDNINGPAILTNAHVVTDMLEGGQITVTASDGVQYDGYVFSLDPLSDLAVIKLKFTQKSEPKKRKWEVVKFGANSDLRPGDWVVAVGCPFGLLNTVTAGVVSSRRRKQNEIDAVIGRDGRVDFIQTDCVVHSGSSGGPLLNLRGEVIGINTTRAESEGITFAIRIDNVMGIIQQLTTTGRVIRPWLGLRMVSLTQNVWQQLRERGPIEYMPQRENGVLITTVFKNSPAEKGGLLEGDVVTEINGKPVSKTHEILGIVGHKTGSLVELTIQRRVPLDVDWDGRVRHFEDQSIKVKITPEEWNVHTHQERDDLLK